MKLTNDILKVKGKYSLKRVVSLISFIDFIALSTYAVIIYESMVLATLTLLFGFTTAVLGISEVSKKFENKQEPIIEE